jgi:SAM-dependent methyltransferase
MTQPSRKLALDPAGAPRRAVERTDGEEHVRFARLDDNSRQDFALGMKAWLVADGQSPAARAGEAAFLRARGCAPGPTELGYEQCFGLLREHPAFAARTRLGWSIHDFMWDSAFRAFRRDAAEFVRAMEQTDGVGPGSLELNPRLEIPRYARHEIHRQPGGFVGDEFAGWVYHYALALAHYPAISAGESEREDVFQRIAASHPVPADGQVRRILDLGCGPGQATTAFKKRFPAAEVWGIDVGGPMVRYAHHRAVKLGVDVHFAQRLAEDSGFPDAHFDLISDYIVFHEVDREARLRIVKEAFRMLRPGGVFGHLDAPTAGHPSKVPPNDIPGKAMLWNIYRHNYEPFYLDYGELDLPAVLREVGFVLKLDGPPVLWNGRPRTLAIKPG